MSTPGWRAASPAELGGVLTRARQSAGFSQREIAERAGFDRSYLSRMETGLATEQVQRLFALMRVLDLELVVRPRGGRGGP